MTEKIKEEPTIYHGELYSYFHNIPDQFKPSTKGKSRNTIELEKKRHLKRHEKWVLTGYFNLKPKDSSDLFVSLPLIQKEEVVGAFHIIYKREKSSYVKENEKKLQQLIKTIEDKTKPLFSKESA